MKIVIERHPNYHLEDILVHPDCKLKEYSMNESRLLINILNPKLLNGPLATVVFKICNVTTKYEFFDFGVKHEYGKPSLEYMVLIDSK